MPRGWFASASRAKRGGLGWSAWSQGDQQWCREPASSACGNAHGQLRTWPRLLARDHIVRVEARRVALAQRGNGGRPQEVVRSDPIDRDRQTLAREGRHPVGTRKRDGMRWARQSAFRNPGRQDDRGAMRRAVACRRCRRGDQRDALSGPVDRESPRERHPEAVALECVVRIGQGLSEYHRNGRSRLSLAMRKRPSSRTSACGETDRQSSQGRD